MLRRTLARGARILPLVVLGALFAWAAWERFRLPLTPVADADIGAYVAPALDKLLGDGFHHYYGQCFLYPGFLYAVLKIVGDFRGITLVQEVLGLGTGALMYGSWEQLRRLLPDSRLPAWIFRLLGAVMVGVYLLSTTSIGFERSLRPEAVFPFFVVLNIFCNLAFIRNRFLERQPLRALLAGGLAVFLSVVAWLLKPSFSAGLLLANLPVLISLCRTGESIRGKLMLVGVPLGAAGLLLLWPEHVLRRDDPDGALYLARSLFTVHANLIEKQIADDIARQATTPYSREFTVAAYDTLSDALRESRATADAQNWPVLGFDPDYLNYANFEKPPFKRWVHRQFETNDQEAAFYRAYYWRTWRGHPGEMAGKITRQMGVFYRFGSCPVYAMYHQGSLAAEYEQSAAALALEPKLLRCAAGRNLIAATNALANNTLQIGPYGWTEKCRGWLSSGYLPCCLGSVLLVLGMWWLPGLRRMGGIAALVALFLYVYNFSVVFSLAVGHSLDVTRYSRYQLAFTLLPEFGSLWLVAEAVSVMLAKWEGTIATRFWRIWERMRRYCFSDPRVAMVGVSGLALICVGAVWGGFVFQQNGHAKHRVKRAKLVVPGVLLVVGAAAVYKSVRLHKAERLRQDTAP